MSLALDIEIAPAGWYPDPAGSGMLRWWNGTWTEYLEEPRPEVQLAAGYSIHQEKSRHASDHF